jgi:hypothetical protein
MSAYLRPPAAGDPCNKVAVCEWRCSHWGPTQRPNPDETLGPRAVQPPNLRYAAVLKRGDKPSVYWEQVGEAPKRILLRSIGLIGDWHGWNAGHRDAAVRASWEGAMRRSSHRRTAPPRVRKTYPTLFEEDRAPPPLRAAKAASPLPIYGRRKGAEDSAPAVPRAPQAQPALPELANLSPNARDRLARGLGHKPAVVGNRR